MADWIHLSQSLPTAHKLVLAYGPAGWILAYIDSEGNWRGRLGRVISPATHWQELTRPNDEQESTIS